MLYTFFLLIFLSKASFLKTEPNVRSSVISALEKVTVFMESRYQDINLDAVLGFHVLQGIVTVWLFFFLGTKLIPAFLTSAFFFDLLSEFAPILGPHFWVFPHSWNQTDTLLAYTSFGSSKSGEESYCALQLYRTGIGLPLSDSSTPSVTCRNIMTQLGCSGYSLSHQLFYFMFADMKGCSDHLFLRTQYYKNIFCASMMKINLQIESNGFESSSRDLFMENTVMTKTAVVFCAILFPLVLLCGMSGFSDFYKLRWLEKILSWQKPKEGCFGEPSKDFEYSAGTEDQKKLLRRVKRREKMFTGI
uniref:Chromosome 16 open reading frame 89 n=1 Tax=Anser brachyrhynchus TaxID=132585 RepID=A0A8B9BDC9_9AVES